MTAHVQIDARLSHRRNQAQHAAMLIARKVAVIPRREKWMMSDGNAPRRDRTGEQRADVGRWRSPFCVRNGVEHRQVSHCGVDHILTSRETPVWNGVRANFRVGIAAVIVIAEDREDRDAEGGERAKDLPLWIARRFHTAWIDVVPAGHDGVERRVAAQALDAARDLPCAAAYITDDRHSEDVAPELQSEGNDAEEKHSLR